MKKTILIISLSAGSGHVRAAQAIEATAKQSSEDTTVHHIDLIDYINLPMKRAVLSSYDVMVRQAPDLWGFVYNKTNNKNITKRLSQLNKKLQKLNAQPLHDYIEKLSPDYILATHFLPLTLIDEELLSRKNIRTGVLITDYDLHELWFTGKNHDYFVATKKIKWKLERKNVPDENLHITGIPIDPVFYKKKKDSDLREEYRIKSKQKVVLVLSGGQGLIHSNELVDTLFTSTEKMTVIAIAGNNKKLEEKLKQLSVPKHIDYRVIGWTNSIDEYMRMADVIVSKPGGLTTSECIALGKKLIAVDPIPGQEEQNTEYLLENNLGGVARNQEDLLFAIEQQSRAVDRKEKNSANIILDKIKKSV
jgi:processive 1,2-diacylglycerol beta-glucosyltransferase